MRLIDRCHNLRDPGKPRACSGSALSKLRDPGGRRRVLLAALLAVSVLAAPALAGCGAPPPTPTPVPVALPTAAPPGREELARAYAPVIIQGVSTDQDYITRADFDGDWVGNNNWENQPGGDLSAHVYYAVFETETHWFFFYSLFHPRDYTDDPCEKSDGCHENDMESLQVIVRKDGSPYGRLQALETLAHSDLYLYSAGEEVGEGFLEVSGEVKLEEGHPVVWVETWGHGIYGKGKILVPHRMTYRVGDAAELPDGVEDEEVGYQLVSIYDTLWQHRGEIGPGRTFDGLFEFRGQTLGYSFDGDDWGQDKANAPWGYPQALGDELARGDWFLDPARALRYHAKVEGEVATTYVYNPFLADLGLGSQ